MLAFGSGFLVLTMEALLNMNNQAEKPLVFVVAATGYIGNHLLLSAGKVTRALGSSTTGEDGHLPLRLDTPADFDYERISPGVVVMLTAAISAPDICSREYDRAWAVNVTGTSKFIENVIDRGARVVFFSSDTTYGECEEKFDEKAAFNPAGDYAKMKCEVERRFSSHASFKAIRLSYVFSREDKFSRYLDACHKRNEEAELFHPFYRAIIHRDDVVEAALALAAHWDSVSEKVINFGGPQVLSRIEFAQCLDEVYFRGLRFKVKQAGSDFFKSRPRVIAMKSPILPRLLGRPPRSLREAANLEFLSSSVARRSL